MANQEQLEILGLDGVRSWNRWRQQNPDVAVDLSGLSMHQAYLVEANLRNAIMIGATLPGANLTSANLEGADLTDATLSHSKLNNASLVGAIFNNAKLEKAHIQDANANSSSFQNAKLLEARFSGSDLCKANFRQAALGGCIFESAKMDADTKGLGSLTSDQFSKLEYIGEENLSDDQSQEPKKSSAPISLQKAIMVSRTSRIILEELSIPNTFDEEHRNLFGRLRESVIQLDEMLSRMDGTIEMLSENQDATTKVSESIPLWKQGFITFLASYGGVLAAEGTSFAAGYTAGYVAGILHDTFSAGETLIV